MWKTFWISYAISAFLSAGLFGLGPGRVFLLFCPAFLAAEGIFRFWAARFHQAFAWAWIFGTVAVWALLFGLPFNGLDQSSLVFLDGFRMKLLPIFKWVFSSQAEFSYRIAPLPTVGEFFITWYLWLIPAWASLQCLISTKQFEFLKKEHEHDLIRARVKNQIVMTSEQFLEFKELRTDIRSLKASLREVLGLLTDYDFSNAISPKFINADGYAVVEGNVLEHRKIAEEILGRSLESKEVVHHMNGIKTDNRYKNLCVMNAQQHEHFHAWLSWHKQKKNFYPSSEEQRKELAEKYGATLL